MEDDVFDSGGYRMINKLRLDHLESLGLDLARKEVLELGPGVGDLTKFFLNKGSEVMCVEGREENVGELIRRNYSVVQYDLDDGLPTDDTFDIVFAFGILYHLQRPAQALEAWAEACDELLLIELCVTPGDELEVNWCEETIEDVRSSINGVGCRPTRAWVFNQLQQLFTYVYVPTTRPPHEEFPADWNNITTKGLTRAFFVASRNRLDNPLLAPELLMQQETL